MNGGDTDAAFKSAEVVVKEHIVNQRLIPNAMEPRGALAQYVGATGEVTLWSTSQNPHIVRFLLSLDTGIPEHKIRVIAPEVGGGFGSKIPHYPEDSMAIFASKKLDRPVRFLSQIVIFLNKFLPMKIQISQICLLQLSR